MAYIGKTPVIGNFVKLDSITVVNGQAAYTMQNGGVNFTSYDNVNQFLVSLNGVLQAPTDSFTVSGSTLTFASNLSTGDVIDFVLVLGNSLDIGTPSDNTVTTAKLGTDAVTEAKIADGAVESEHLNNNIISGQTALTSEPADTDEFLISDAGTIKRIDYSLIKGGGITEVDRWLMVDASYSSGSTLTNWSRHNTSYTGVPHGSGMSASAGIWTFPSTGVYEITIMTYLNNGTTTRQYVGIQINGTNDAFSSNNTSLGVSYGNVNTAYDHDNLFVQGIYDVTNTSNNKLKFVVDSGGSCGFYTTIATFKKLMET